MNQRPLVVHYNGIVLSQIAESDRMAQTLVLRVSIVFTETIVIPYRSNVASGGEDAKHHVHWNQEKEDSPRDKAGDLSYRRLCSAVGSQV